MIILNTKYDGGFMMTYNAKSQKKYNENSIFYHIKYTPKENIEGERLKEYLKQSGKTANSYIKELIKNDLDSKGFMINNDYL